MVILHMAMKVFMIFHYKLAYANWICHAVKLMMTGTIRDNILYGINRNVSDEELIKYAKLANCHDFIMQFMKDTIH